MDDVKLLDDVDWQQVGVDVDHAGIIKVESCKHLCQHLLASLGEWVMMRLEVNNDLGKGWVEGETVHAVWVGAEEESWMLEEAEAEVEAVELIGKLWIHRSSKRGLVGSRERQCADVEDGKQHTQQRWSMSVQVDNEEEDAVH